MTKDTQQNDFDLSEFDEAGLAQESGIEVVIQHPVTMEDTSMVVMVAGPDSERRKNAQRRYINNRIKKRKMKLDAVDIERESMSVLAQSVISWSGFVVSGKPLECTPENVMVVFKKYPWVHEQVSEKAEDRTAFFKS